MQELTDRQRDILAFEREYPVWQYQGLKEAEVRRRFDVTLTRYWQEVNAILDLPAAEAHDVHTVRRLRRVRTTRQRSRSLRRTG